MRHFQRRGRPSARPGRRSGRGAGPRGNRENWRELGIMAAIGAVFIGAFAFAFTRPVVANLQQRVPPAVAAEQVAEAQVITRKSSPNIAASIAVTFPCDEFQVTDGDTIRCGQLRVRLASIDAPEMPGSCRRGRVCVAGDPYASAANLERLMVNSAVKCRQTDTDRYGRIVALCSAGSTDLSCAQVEQGFAVVRYGQLTCSGRVQSPAM